MFVSLWRKDLFMRFEDILGDERLWAVVYDGQQQNALTGLFSQWTDLDYLYAFFEKNWSDLNAYFRITSIEQAVIETGLDAMSLKAVILDIRPEANLDQIFRPLENGRIQEMVLSKEKAKGSRQFGHPSWLRIYALKFELDAYLITGGAIKLTRTMEEREHTHKELMNLERVRCFLLEAGAVDLDGFKDLNS
jgi:hypothetical protein